MAPDSAPTTDPFVCEGEGWETLSPGVRRRIIPSDMGIRIIPENPAETQAILEIQNTVALPDEEWAPIALLKNGAKGLERAGTLAQARKRLREYPRFGEYNSPVEWAISRDTTELLEGILGKSGIDGEDDQESSRFDPNTVSSNRSALYHAVSNNKIHNTRLLLEHGADPNMYSLYQNDNHDDLWQMPLHCAARDWRFESIELLIKHGADINALSLLKGQTALLHALLAAWYTILGPNRHLGDLEATIRCLVSAGADVKIRDESLHSPIDALLLIDHKTLDQLSIAKMILEAGADINDPGMGGNSAFLILAMEKRSPALVHLFLESGKPKLDQQNDEGKTALHFVVERGDLEAVNQILKAGANPNIQGSNGETPLHEAAERRGYHEIVKSLLSSADPTIKSKSGKTAIELALMSGGIKETMEVFARHEASRSFIEANKENLKAAALKSGTSLSQFDLLIGSSPKSPSLATKSGSDTNTAQVPAPVVSASFGPLDVPNLETIAFTESVHKFESLIVAVLPPTGVRIVPKRLMDVTTGEIISGDSTMKYVIGSYIWSPEKMPCPQDPRAYESIYEKSDRLVEACQKYPDLIELVPPGVEGLSTVKFPPASMYPAEPNPAYLSEIYWLLAQEALHRGLRFVWIDSFCITQTDDKDKEEQLPLMADYYRNAECCVVISESLRRHLLPEHDPSRNFFDSGDSVTDRLLAWAIGFHFNRVWVFQETRLAKEVITRASNVRIKTTEVLSSNFNADSPDANKLWRFVPRSSYEAVDKTKSAICKANQKLPLSGSSLNGEQPLSLDSCLRLLYDRDSLLCHDKIYGILGIFPSPIRKSLTISYKLPLSTIFAIFLYLRIRSGDLIGLLSVRAPDQQLHNIEGAPSWLVSGYGFNYSDILDLQLDSQLDFQSDRDGKLFLQMDFCRVADCYRTDDHVFGVESHAEHGNILLRVMDKEGRLHDEIRRAAVEPVDPNYNFTAEAGFGGISTWITRPAIVPTQLSAADELRVTEEREYRRSLIKIAARQDKAVIAKLGVEKKGAGTFQPLLKTIWLILCTENEGHTWQRMGIFVLEQMTADAWAGPSGFEKRKFCIV